MLVGISLLRCRVPIRSVSSPFIQRRGNFYWNYYNPCSSLESVTVPVDEKLLHSPWTFRPPGSESCVSVQPLLSSSCVPFLCCLADLSLLSCLIQGATPVGFKGQKPTLLPGFQGNTGPCFQKLQPQNIKTQRIPCIWRIFGGLFSFRRSKWKRGHHDFKISSLDQTSGWAEG